ncbi:hemolysin family protein [Rhodoluna sp. KAS3]|uniref:hemolysin family protein n=1 Tax=Rhodoluna sp. KAS3 TaxID=942880 RepID=UPI002232254F|nr:hemolysin family protein [Rhodoluna sp. KAS3]BDS49313.1 membrane protein [Rhodoluna sp. KAS3]
MNSDLQGLVWFVVLLLTNAFFVGAEFALISARRAQIEPRAEAGSRPAKITLRAMERVSLMLATAQLGITISSLLILLIAEPSIHHLLEYPLHFLGLSDELVSTISFAITLLLVTYLHVVVGEMVPKNLAIALPERSALILTPVLYGLAMLVKPLVGSLNAVSNAILRLFKFEPKDEATSSYTLDQVEDIVEHSTREGALSDVSGTLSNTFEFTEKKVIDVAIPVEKLVAFATSVTPREVEQAVAKYGFSRYPLTDSSGELMGYLHLKDVIDLEQDEIDDAFPTKRIRSLISLPASMELEDALASMRRVHAHMAKAFDKSGNVLGVLFLEDILEELVGEVQDATTK